MARTARGRLFFSGGAVNFFDSAILLFMHQFTLIEPAFDRAVKGFTVMYSTRGLLLITALWWLWARGGAQARRDKEIVVATVASGFVALFLGRFLAAWLPFRDRPFLNPELALYYPYESNEDLTAWSSFPSDHAMLWFAVAMGIFVASRGLGVLALIFAGVVVCMPRIYVGLHYPTDILVGAVIGILVNWVLCRPAIRERIAAPFLALEQRHPGPFLAAMFIVGFLMVSQFDDVRRIASELAKLANLV